MQKLVHQEICSCMYMGTESSGENPLRLVKLEVRDGEINNCLNAMKGRFAFFPISFNPDKHQVVMIERGVEYVWPVEDDPKPRKYHNEYELYLAYMRSLKDSSGKSFSPWNYTDWCDDWETKQARREAILQQYAKFSGGSYKPLSSLQERPQGDAFYFALYVTPSS